MSMCFSLINVIGLFINDSFYVEYNLREIRKLVQNKTPLRQKLLVHPIFPLAVRLFLRLLALPAFHLVVFGTLVDVGRKYGPIREEVEMLLCRISLENEKGTEKLCDLVMKGKISGTVLARSLNTFPDSFWQLKFRGLLKSAMKFNDHDTTLAALTIIDKCLVDAKPIRKRIYRKLQQRRRGIKTDASMSVLDRRRVQIANRHLDSCATFGDWLEGKLNVYDCEAPPEKKPRNDTHTSGTAKEHDAWMWRCLFSPWMAVRAAAAKIIVAVVAQPGHLGAAVSVILRGLPLASVAPEAMTDHFFRAAHVIMSGGPGIKARLYSEGLHVWLIKVIFKECKRMHEEEQQETSMDHSFGTLLQLLCLLLTGSGIESLKLKAARDHILVPLLQLDSHANQMYISDNLRFDVGIPSDYFEIHYASKNHLK
ncbi:unnamed protein product [Cylicocyclus nassatus]|uniref:NUP210 fourth Ig-like domain-containing protein n=1 Tax=Cylicocyclus nassatus TaxID=53992 RepID=A0AA36DR64_CYLNA|nr:unnamed protein product [Cylicocyclus nassatus]